MALAFDIISGKFIDKVENKNTLKTIIPLLESAIDELISERTKNIKNNTILSGVGEPEDSLGNDGDFYIELKSWEIYKKDGGAWGEGVKIIGQSGLNGANGLNGENGSDGEHGEDGTGIVAITQPASNKMQVQLSNGDSYLITIPAGKDGKEVELKSTATHVQWRYKDGEWANLFQIPQNFYGSGGGRARLSDFADKITGGTNITVTTDNSNNRLNIGLTGIVAEANGGTGYTSNYAALYYSIYNMGYNPLPTDYYAVNFPVYDDGSPYGLVTVNLGDFYTATVQGGGIANGKPLYNTYSSVNNSGSSETDLDNQSLAQYIMASDGYKLWIKDCGIFAANANNTRIRRYIGSTVIFDSGAVAFNSGDWTLETQILRTGVLTARVQCNWLCSNTLLASKPQVTLVTGLNWQLGTTTSKITGQGAASSDITFYSSTTQIIGAAY